MGMIPWAPSQWTDDLGRPLAFGKLYLYQAGTLIPKAAYQDAAHTVAHPFPIVLDATGSANVWLIDDEAYDLVVHDANDNVLRSVLGILTSGSGGGETPAAEPGVFEVESFPFSEGILVRDSATIWSPGGCFCWFRPCVGWSRIKYIKTVFPGSAGFNVGRYSIWGWDGNPGSQYQKLVDRPLFDGIQVAKEDLDIPLTGYRWVLVAMDPAFSLAPDYVKQAGQGFPEVTAFPFPNSSGYVGAHAQNTTFETFPAIRAQESRYLVTKWIALGVEA